ncbi:MAG: DUF1080 domain-containing protein [Candidatus Binatia bacterium]|nr:DUF1080 domain-containing protein [Candidatus Binatia bacterium]
MVQVVVLLLLLLACRVDPAWSVEAPKQLFNGRDFQHWDRYLGAQEVPWWIFATPKSTDVLGIDHDPDGVFSIVMEDGDPAIRISGEIWGALISRQEFEDYHFSMEVKWGDERFPPREASPPNSGLLYHSVGPLGAFWTYWMRSAELEILQGATGMFVSVDGIRGSIRTSWDRSALFPWLRYDPDGGDTAVGFPVFRVSPSDDFERPLGQWNRIEIRVVGDSAIHLVNGRTVLEVRDLRHQVGDELVPLTRGKLQIQSEGAELFIRDLSIRPAQPEG